MNVASAIGTRARHDLSDIGTVAIENQNKPIEVFMRLRVAYLFRRLSILLLPELIAPRAAPRPAREKQTGRGT